MTDTTNTWLFNTEKYVYKEVAKQLNVMYGQDRTAPLAVGVFLKVPMKFNLVQRDEVDYKKLTDIFTAYTKVGDEVSTYFDFFYSKEKDLPKLTKLIEKHATFWAYVYQHELLHILLKHITKPFRSRMTRIAKECKPNIDESSLHNYINIAEDYFINYSIKDVVAITDTGLSTFLEFGLYKADYQERKLSDIQILKEILADTKVTNQSLGNGYSIQTVTDKDGNTSQSITKDGTGTGELSGNGSEGVSDTELADLASAVNQVIQSHAKGSGSATCLNDLFSSIQINTDWFKKLRTRFKRDVYYATHDYYTKWTNLNNRYRRIFKAPKKYFLASKLEIVLSIDQSGSMPRDSLQKLLYLMETEGKKISKLTVLIHDSAITKEFVLDSDYGIDSNPNFKTALATRYQSGGTSHADVFKWLQDNVKDPSKSLFMSFSDNYSDIEQELHNYPIMRAITSYFICPVNNPMKGCTNILME